ncbi:hypothetical protein AVEN_213287-1 [Araneus ventricosus]|uniref:Uncharacterized protein n=1 Tax=Araneus ventricosus TaxID=182803 RepID=A0A4Y2IP86_ARAVE|nr:hypothetical protein AVEN_213287-1 [Araneus ventricosus]
MVPTVICYLISTSSDIYSPGGQSSAPPIATWGGVPIFTPVPVFTPVPLRIPRIPNVWWIATFPFALERSLREFPALRKPNNHRKVEMQFVQMTAERQGHCP